MIWLSDRDKRILGEIYPGFAKNVSAWMKACWDQNLEVHLTQGFRYFGEQDVLYKAGTSPAPGGSSYHNYGLAIDFCFDNDPNRPGIQDPYKEPVPGAFGRVADLAEGLGLRSGRGFPKADPDHVQAIISCSLLDLRTVFLKGDIKAVYRYLDDHGGLPNEPGTQSDN